MCFLTKFSDIFSEHFYVAANTTRTKQLTVYVAEAQNYFIDNYLILQVPSSNLRLIDNKEYANFFNTLDYGISKLPKNRPTYMNMDYDDEYAYVRDEDDVTERFTTDNVQDYASFQIVDSLDELIKLDLAADKRLYTLMSPGHSYIVAKLQPATVDTPNVQETSIMYRVSAGAGIIKYAPIVFEHDIYDAGKLSVPMLHNNYPDEVTQRKIYASNVYFEKCIQTLSHQPVTAHMMNTGREIITPDFDAEITQVLSTTVINEFDNRDAHPKLCQIDRTRFPVLDDIANEARRQKRLTADRVMNLFMGQGM